MSSSQFGDNLHGVLQNNATDRYELIALSGGEVTFNFVHPHGVGTGGQAIELKLVDADNNQIALLTVTGNGKILTTVPTAGTYYLQVRDADFWTEAPANYEITTALRYAPATTYDGGANNAGATALLTPLGNTVRGRLENMDTDYFKVDAATGGVLALRFAHPHGPGTEGHSIEVAVTDSDGHSVISRTLSGDATLVTTVDQAGTYYVRIKNPSFENDPGLYTLTTTLDSHRGIVYDGPDNNSPQNALALGVDTTAIGTIDNLDKDYFKVDVGTAGMLALNFLHPNGPGTGGDAVSLEITDSAGKQVIAKSEHGSDIVMANLASGGTYYVKVANPGLTPQAGLYKLMAGVAGNGGKIITITDPAPQSGTAGNDVVMGSTGRDTMLYHGNVADYDISVSPAGAAVYSRNAPDGTDTLFNVERLHFADKNVALDIDGDGGRMLRLYQAAFDRAPDEGGFGYWLARLDAGVRIHAVAEGFINSDEFAKLYGAQPSNQQFVQALYTNVLHRAPDQAGMDYWTHTLDQNLADRADVLISVADSPENVAQLVGATMHGITYVPWN